MMYGFLEGLPVLIVGFLLGVIHSFDLDHIAAVSSVIIKSNNLIRALMMGAWWGVGHTGTLIVIGIIILFFKLSIPKQLSLTFEFIVSIILVILGIKVLKEILIKRGHWHRHRHSGKDHIHFHYHGKLNAHNHNHTSLIIGIIHGIAGSSAIMILVLATIQYFWAGILFILVFGLGSIIGMAFISGIISFSLLYSSNISKLTYFTRLLIGVFSLSLGLHLMMEILL